MFFYSIVIPVFNRPEEIDELLASLATQTYKNFEVLIIEDGSTDKCDLVVGQHRSKLNLQYFYKENSGQGFSRNHGFSRAKGDYFVVFDSDCLIPPHYLAIIDEFLQKSPLDAFGGPDQAHGNFTLMQKAISYSMTSFFTTGGIRGKKKSVGEFHPRSFNMGISKAVFANTGGYIITRMGEDIEFSIRIIKAGFKVGLIPDAFVYHKRRTTLGQFYKQLHFFGRARINISSFYPKELKLVHVFPALFLLAVLSLPVLYFLNTQVFTGAIIVLAVYLGLIFVDSTVRNANILVGLLSVLTSIVQLMAYGVGFIQEGLKKLTESK